MLCIQSLMNQSINNSGRNNDRLGNSVIKMSTNTLTIKNGKPALLTFAMETFPILEATNRQTPTGGVVKPMIKFKTAITAKCMGSTSTEIATFNKIGNSIKSAAMVSINVPTTISTIFINSNTKYLFVVKPTLSVDNI